MTTHWFLEKDYYIWKELILPLISEKTRRMCRSQEKSPIEFL